MHLSLGAIRPNTRIARDVTNAALNALRETWHSRVVISAVATTLSLRALILITKLSECALEVLTIFQRWTPRLVGHWGETFHLLVRQSVH